MSNNRDYIYDIESYPNFFCIVFEELNGTKKVSYEISEWENESSQLLKLLEWFAQNKKRLIGFSSLGYDYPMLHHFIENTDGFMSGEEIANSLHQKTVQIIETPFNERFQNMIWENDRHIEQIDLFKIHHFDNSARGTSLKQLEFAMRLDRIQDLPIKPNTIVTREEADLLLDYCANSDVPATKKFALETVDMINFRMKLKKEFPKISINDSDAKIGSSIIIQELESRLGDNICYEKVGGKRQPRQTFRNEIVLDEIIFDYIQFERPEFNATLDFLKSRVLYETKGAFSDIPKSELGELEQYVDKITVNRKTKFETLKNLNVIVDGFQFDVGTGGIHGCASPQLFESNDDYIVVDVDVGSFYPSLAIANSLYPEHLTEGFVGVYAVVVEKKNNAEKDSMGKGAYKLAANASYGNSNSIYSPFYDPKFTMSITVNGQLLLMMLSEQLMKISSLTMIQANTDGVTVRLKRSDVERLRSVCRSWEEMSGLELEEITYSRMWVRDVNNYISEYDIDTHGDDGKGQPKYKLKGQFDYNLGWHQNHSNLLSRKAAVAFLTKGTPINEFINNHWQQTKNGHSDNIFDFMLRTKIAKTMELVQVQNDNEQLSMMGDLYQSLDIQSRMIIEEKGFEQFHKAYEELVLSGKCDPTKTIKSHEPIAKLLDIKPKPAKAGYQAYLEVINSGRNSFPETVIRETQQNTTRYFVSNSDSQFFKIMPPLDGKTSKRYSSIESGWKVTQVNNMREIDKSEINFDYYIEQAEKLVSAIVEGNDKKCRKLKLKGRINRGGIKPTIDRKPS